MNIKRLRRKLYKLTHPKIAEVWMLHRVVTKRSDIPQERLLEITPEWLLQHIEEHQKQGGNFVSVDALMHPSHLHPSSVAITIDEGCRETLHNLLPLFEKYQIPFLLFVVTGFVNNEHLIPWYSQQPKMMDWDELTALSRHPLCTIGAHTISHPHLCQIDTVAAQKEIEQSRHLLEAHLKQPINYFSYPFGECSRILLELVQKSGYTAAFEAWGGAMRTLDNPYNLPRIPLTQV